MCADFQPGQSIKSVTERVRIEKEMFAELSDT